ncbi:hypothetical protein EUGRSUZ_A00082 [Eucalyptus grandis]|uniref:Uncharacterized protein n=1 Tax=Eucalyptus grandis TaxID=71139 RepID=A0ACC3LZE2_EUCGR|nr:hypothetical protein EUGRSUZ_A00082 [Eucalyptus grandis]
MSSIAISYGENGPVFCGLNSDGSHLATCYGSNTAIIYGIPGHFPLAGLTAGDGFVCGLLLDSSQPYCWGSSAYIQMGVPQPITKGAQYQEISAGDYHLCGLRKPLTGRRRNVSLVDCWGYNMTASHAIDGQIHSISAGSGFNCGLFAQNGSVYCWGDETSSHAISLVPKDMRFKIIAAGGYHVCGIVAGDSSRVYCWGRSLVLEEEISVAYSSYSSQGNVDLPPRDPMTSIVGGKFHACGIKSADQKAICWGFVVKHSTPAPSKTKILQIAAGNYFMCGILAEKSLLPVCWGLGFPTSLPVAVSPGLCKSVPCAPGTYEFSQDNAPCSSSNSRVCMPCSSGCPAEMYQTAECTSKSDRKCGYNCSSCFSTECFSNCSANSNANINGTRNRRFWSLQLPVIVAEIVFAVFLVIVVSTTAAMARTFTYEELERATSGFKEESQVGKGSFSCVFKGVLKNGTVVAVKRAIMSSDKQKNSKEFRTELDLLSRLNHAHLLNLLGYCEEGGERLLVYEFMAHGSLHQHLHGKNKALKERLDWVRRVTIAVQAARGIEYLHGYACPPVIHRDIKSSNILIDEEHNARVADFGLSLLGPVDSGSPLAELPAGTLGYLDPEYYRLHYLTTKSDPLHRATDMPTEVVLGSSRMHKKSSQRSSNRSISEADAGEGEDQRFEFRAPSWITFPSVTSSQRRKSSVSDADIEGKNFEAKNATGVGDGLRSLEEEIGPASPQEKLFLQHNF